MEEFSPRRRDVKREAAFSSLKRLKTDLKIVEILVIFTTSAGCAAMPGLYDPVSITIRALLLCDLALAGSLRIDDRGTVYPTDTYMPIDELHDEVHSKLRKAAKEKTVDKWILLLNGESYSLMKDKYHIKNARKRVGKMLVSKNILRKAKSKTKAFLEYITNRGDGSVEGASFKGAKAKVALEVTAYLTGEEVYEEADVLKLDILVCAFAFCSVTEDLFLTLPPSAAEVAQKKTHDIIGRYKGSLGDTSQPAKWAVHSILRAYLKLASWI
ncbi:golgi phosphoprotein 3 [Nematocida major]|uniref:golgi phosphoprotein 3 n=1 Tax=Nematocida major TaxID=1912982 RepID=UPI0020083561|nr:golgi phosphoprotein 3 [Nematocida major]KAH9386369.1 golgi phosphoprotein 3 [Nematocida major]